MGKVGSTLALEMLQAVIRYYSKYIIGVQMMNVNGLQFFSATSFPFFHSPIFCIYGWGHRYFMCPKYSRSLWIHFSILQSS